MPEIAEEPQVDRAPELPSMGFLDHLEELRRRILRALISVAAGFGVAFWFHEQLFAFMQKPIVAALAQNNFPDKLKYLSPTEPFNVYLKISLIAGLFLASPFVLYQVWAFIAPGLYRKEKRYVLPFMFFAVALFFAGGYFGYAIAYPRALEFLIGYGSQFDPTITIGHYTDLFLTVMIGLGVVFEMPVIIFFLALMGIVRAGFLLRNFRYALLIIVIVSAILTPTSDVMNLMIFATPMTALYLLSIGVAWMVQPKRRRASE